MKHYNFMMSVNFATLGKKANKINSYSIISNKKNVLFIKLLNLQLSNKTSFKVIHKN